MNCPITASTLVWQKMNAEQLKSLQENVLKKGVWENARSCQLMMDFGTLLVIPKDGDGVAMIEMGIEPDGYCHS